MPVSRAIQGLGDEFDGALGEGAVSILGLWASSLARMPRSLQVPSPNRKAYGKAKTSSSEWMLLHSGFFDSCIARLKTSDRRCSHCDDHHHNTASIIITRQGLLCHDICAPSGQVDSMGAQNAASHGVFCVTPFVF